MSTFDLWVYAINVVFTFIMVCLCNITLDKPIERIDVRWIDGDSNKSMS